MDPACPCTVIDLAPLADAISVMPVYGFFSVAAVAISWALVRILSPR